MPEDKQALHSEDYAIIGNINKNDCHNHSVIFYATDQTEFIRFDLETKEIFIKGKLVTTDKEIVDGFRDFINLALK
nr:MAG TPA: hypothetical protein [Caudoviricetes sp.]